MRAIAQALGGHCTSLRRTAVGPFELTEAQAVEAVELQPVAAVLERLPAGGSGTRPGSHSQRSARARRVTVAAPPGGAAGPRPRRSRSARSTASTSGTAPSSAQRSTRACVPTVVTFDPHPRTVLGNQVELLSTLERRLELLDECGVEDVLVVEFTEERGRARPRRVRRARTSPRSERGSSPSATGFRFGRGREGDVDLLRAHGLDARRGAARRERLVDAHQAARARLRARRRPPSCSGARSKSTAPSSPATAAAKTLGFPTANLRVDPHLLVPGFRDLRRAPQTASGPPSRSGSTRTTAAPSGGSRPICSTGRAISTATGSCWSSGGSCATSGLSRAKRTWWRRSPATSRRPARRPGRGRPQETACCRRLSVTWPPPATSSTSSASAASTAARATASPPAGEPCTRTRAAPRCGYLGWIATTVPTERRSARPLRRGSAPRARARRRR